MTPWSKDELRKIGEADDLHTSPLREDGATYGTPTWVWSIAVDGDLYVRATSQKMDVFMACLCAFRLLPNKSRVEEYQSKVDNADQELERSNEPVCDSL